jgi:hypothetical protein
MRQPDNQSKKSLIIQGTQVNEKKSPVKVSIKVAQKNIELDNESHMFSFGNIEPSFYAE